MNELALRKEKVDVLQYLMQDTRSPNTKRAYLKDVQMFSESIRVDIQEFLLLSREQALGFLLQFKANQMEQGLSEATINRRLASIKALVKMGNSLGLCSFTLVEVKGEKIQKYRDTTGVNQDVFKQALSLPDRTTTKGKRDYALLRLLWENALRRGEVAKLKWSDLEIQEKRLKIFGKGRGNQAEWISLSAPLINALEAWRSVSPNTDGHIFLALDTANYGQGLATNGIYLIVRGYFERLGITKVMSPHRIRHSAITAVLDASKGDVRKVQKFSRHKQLDTLLIYDDNRLNAQGEMTSLASSLLD